MNSVFSFIFVDKKLMQSDPFLQLTAAYNNLHKLATDEQHNLIFFFIQQKSPWNLSDN